MGESRFALKRVGPVVTVLLIMGETIEGAQGKPNRLIHEKSPYLQQHAYNPVEWRPWGEEAFEAARREGKPIFLSIGYSTCHWCHVMERESFADPDTARLLNSHFIPIKVDREERPDVDRLYMTAVQAMTGQGGWPLNAFLTPDLKPFYGGTYFPPVGRWGVAGFPDVLRRIAELWKEDRAKLVSSGEEIGRALKGRVQAGAGGAPNPKAIEGAVESLKDSFDPQRGGFGGAPKFPMPVNINFLLRAHARGAKGALDMALKTLREMARGGIRDHIGGGFHRYSTDALWHVPHFEKMLYDNAQIAANYVEAHQASGDPALARVARQTLDYVLRDMAHPDGGFYSAEDADSLPAELAGKVEDIGHEHRKEGAFYIWAKDEILSLAGREEGEIFCHRYGVDSHGNAEHDPHGEFAGRNILFEAYGLEETAKRFGKAASEVEVVLEKARQALFQARSRRPRPQKDDKILVSWNGLMISALAKGGAVLEEERYVKAAEGAAHFIRRNLYDSGAIFRRWREGERKVPGMADDYAFLAQGLLDLYEASFDPKWLFWAEELMGEMNRLFLDPGRGGYFMTAEGHDERLIARVKDDSDNVEPAASSIAALNLLRLSSLLDRKDFREAAEKTLSLYAEAMSKSPRALPQMLVALDALTAKSRQVVIVGRKGSDDAGALLARVRARFIPYIAVVFLDEGSRAELSGRMPWLEGIVMKDGKATAYVCVNHACSLPTTDPERMSRQLEAPAGP